VQTEKRAHAEVFREVCAWFGRNEPVKLVDKNNLGALAKPGALYFPGPDIAVGAWQRSFFGHGRWSLCGITHTTASAAAMDAIAACRWRPCSLGTR